ncbi:MAG: hypothetical protein CVU56_21630 [Deltaproteobacteria bacterium HGW-Deltaproteobacteria-14]|jgi:hypothetical protein|nr:MAG: hypothetical protein CVU56_21630 [Deltaproteobacteria bacterium HGW-Deltaproteobacteria-14]
MRTTALTALLLTSGLTAACGTYASHVEADDATLGRVVVYRNGIAYYERTAQVTDGSLTLTVPHDKVDDFLKSLTVKDAKSGETLPVSFPTSGATSDGKVDMRVQIAEAGVHDVVLTYITESPAWKPSYRVMVAGDDVRIQGWAIVDNTSGEKWDNVRIGVGSSSALSFRYDLRSVRTVFRETLKSEERFAVAPPTGGSTYGQAKDGEQVIAAVDMASIPMPDDRPAAAAAAPQLARESEQVERTLVTQGRGGSAYGRSDGGGGRSARTSAARRPATDAPPPPAPVARTPPPVKQLAEQLNHSGGQIVIEGYAGDGERDAEQVSSDRANWLRNELIREGVAPARLRVAAKGRVAGQSGGVRLVQTEPAASPELAVGDPIGESHFQSEATVTVDRGTSAMIAILDDKADGNIVYLYDAESARGNERYAFKAIRFKNPTESTLETGPMTVYGEGRFIGEGLSEPIPPHSTAVVPFALDREIIVDRTGSTDDRIARLVTLQRGILRTEVQHTRKTTLKVTSLLHKDTEVFVRHTVRKGWKLVESPKTYEQTGEAHLFRVALKAGETKTLEIEEATPLVKAIDVRSPEGLALVRAYVEGGDEVDERFAAPMKKLLAIHTEMANITQGIEAARERVEEFRVRTSELQGQIVSLDGVRGGNALLKHLQQKLREMSDRVQKDTIAIVDMQQQLMLAHIRFQDGVAELSFEQRTAKAAEQPEG